MQEQITKLSTLKEKPGFGGVCLIAQSLYKRPNFMHDWCDGPGKCCFCPPLKISIGEMVKVLNEGPEGFYMVVGI